MTARGETYVYPASLFRRGSVPPPTGRIPREIVEFFNAPGGHSLIVKGPAGTGKTTFALQLTEALGEVTASHYLSSRVSDESLYRQFTWLKDRIKPSILQTGSKSPHNTKVARHALDQLEGKLEEGKEGEDEEPEAIGSGEVKGNFLEVTLGFDLPELEAAYDFVDDRIPARSLVLIDSIDALAEHYGIPAGRLITVLQKDLVEGSKQNVLYVLESSGETRLDYLGDGVVHGGPCGPRGLGAARDHLHLGRPGPGRRPRPATKGERRVPPRVSQSPPASGRVRRTGARLRVGDPRLRGRLADRAPHGRHERRLGLEMDERGVPAPEIGTSVPRVHGVRHARVGVRGKGPRGDVGCLLVGPASERRVRRVRHPPERLRVQAGEPRPGRAPPG